MTVQKTYVINIDGMRSDYYNTTGHQGCLTPALTWLVDRGVLFTNCQSTMPANTGTNHCAILTSTHAGSHGILGIGGYYAGLDFNHFRLSRKYGMAKAYVFEHRHLQIQTMFNVIKSKNPALKTGFITGKTWLGSILPDEDCDSTIYPNNTMETCGVHQPNPSYVTPALGYVLGGLAHPEDNELFPRVYIPAKNESEPQAPAGTINLAVVEFDADKLPSDQWITDQAIACVTHDDPDFLYIVFMNMDIAGHAYGCFLADDSGDENVQKNLSTLRNPNAARDQLFLTDQNIRRFIDYIDTKHGLENVRIVITSDHGMSTMKTLFSSKTREEITHWMYGHIGSLYDPYTVETISPFKSMECLDIDIREILADNGIYMRASPDKFLKRYNSNGKYDWCISEGPNGYIYNADSSVQQQIKDILLEYTIQENESTIHPIWKVLTRDEQQTAINEYTGKPFCLGKGNFLDMIWPSVMIFCKPHYMIPMYHDQLLSALMPLMIKMKLPGFIDSKTAMGAHGTYEEQDVPLIIMSQNESQIPTGVAVGRQVSVLDILPTLCELNGWMIPSSFEGTSILPL